jgi:hypothetical protein
LPKGLKLKMIRGDKKPVKLSMLIGAAVILSIASCAGTEIPGSASPAGSDLFDRVKPVFVLPVSDIDRGNGIEAVFVDETGTEEGAVLEITVVFYDEDHPSGITDALYDVYRSFRYRRVRDVETFFFHFHLDGVESSWFDFPGTYARDQVFREKKVEHFSAEVPASSFDYTGPRPVIHVTTWNHLFREISTEADIETITLSGYPVYRGTRAAAEEILTKF